MNYSHKGFSMQKRKFTVVTQLHETNNTDLIEYIDKTRVLYAKAMNVLTISINHHIIHLFKTNMTLPDVQRVLL